MAEEACLPGVTSGRQMASPCALRMRRQGSLNRLKGLALPMRSLLENSTGYQKSRNVSGISSPLLSVPPLRGRACRKSHPLKTQILVLNLCLYKVSLSLHGVCILPTP